MKTFNKLFPFEFRSTSYARMQIFITVHFVFTCCLDVKSQCIHHPVIDRFIAIIAIIPISSDIVSMRKWVCTQSVTLSISFKWSHTGTIYMKCSSQDVQDIALSGKRNFVAFYYFSWIQNWLQWKLQKAEQHMYMYMYMRDYEEVNNLMRENFVFWLIFFLFWRIELNGLNL